MAVERPGTMGSGWGADITVTQDATTLTIEYAQFARSDMQPPTRFVYRLEWIREPEHHQHGPRSTGAGLEDGVGREHAGDYDGAHVHRLIES